MAEGDGPVKAEAVDAALNGMKLEEELMPDVEDGTQSTGPPTPGSTNNVKYSSSPRVKTPNSQGNLDSTAPTPKTEDEGAQGVSDITIQVEPGKTPKLSRKATSKMAKKPALLFDDLPDATVESKTHFTAIRECIYGSKYMGASEHDTLGCDCSPEYKNGANNACGEDSDCINRATKMECTDDECNCGAGCQNQRFQRRQYAKVSVIKTEKKGFGLRADTDLQPQDFIFEYIGEVINEAVFRRRTHQYHDEGIKHFYFMSLTKNVFVDATKKGNLGRFCNHSCNPNCYVDKWVVGDKLRMGIFAERPIRAGEELVFNYNVDRYGADPQPCYCGENNCTGFIGGKTQTERATKLSNAVIEALGIEDGDGWDIAVAKKPRKKKQGEDDEEYVNNVQPKGLDENGVTKVMATLMQCKEKWVAVKLLSRVQRCNDDKVRNRVVRMHGYQILGSTLKNFKDDNNVVLQILDILYKLPRLTRNKIVDSKIETAISTLIDAEHDDIAKESKRLLDEWGKLDLGYRIPRKKFDPNASEPAQNAFERTRRTSDSKPEVPEKPIVAPSGPRSNVPQRNNSFYRAPPRPKSNLPTGWFATVDQSGRTYYYSKAGQTTWQRPNEPAADPPPPPVATAKANQKALQSIIDSITKIEPASKSASPAPKDSVARSKKEKKAKEDWRSWPVDKQMRQYENTISKHVIPIMNRFSGKLPKDVLKRFAKDIGKKLVASDFKNNTVTDVRGIPEKKARKIKGHVTEFFKKAVVKQAAHDAEKAEKARARATKGGTDTGDASTPLPKYQTNAFSARTEEVDVEMSDDEGASGNIISMNGTPFTPAIGTPDEEGLKRKRSDLELDDLVPLDMPLKRLKESPTESLSPPPPPPPPPGGDLLSMTAEEEEEEVLMRESEEALMKENEEAMVEDEFMRNKESAGRSLEDTVNGGNNYSNGSRPHSTSMGKRIGSGSADKNIQLERDSNSPQTPESSSCMDESFDLLHPDRRRQLQDQRKRAMGL